MIRYLSIIFILLLVAAPAHADQSHQEKYYQESWCREHNGQTEVVLPDQTRADCITASHAIEFDFAKKWYEALGQALYYGLQTGKRPGIVLIIESPTDRKYWLRLNSTIDHFKLPVDTWEIK